MAAAEERGAVVRLGSVQAVHVTDEPSPHVTGMPQDCVKTAVIGLKIVHSVNVDSMLSYMLKCSAAQLLLILSAVTIITKRSWLACLHDSEHRAVCVQQHCH